MIVVSMIVPLYKGKKYIRELINTVCRNAKNLNKNKQMLEVIFVNDYPEENITAAVDNYTLDAKREGLFPSNLSIKTICNKENIGIHGSRLEGLRNCKGDFVHFLDQDDRIDDGFIASQLNTIRNADVVVANGYSFNESVNGNKLLYRYAFMQWTVKYIWFYTKYDCRIISPGQCLINRNSIPDKWTQNIVKNNGADDYMLWLLMLTQKKCFKINRARIYTHVNTGGNTSSNLEGMKRSISEVIELIGSDIGRYHCELIRSNLGSSKKKIFVSLIEKLNRE